MSKSPDNRLTVECQADGILGFCRAHDISRALLYRLWAEGKGPDRIKVGNRTLITREAAARWRSQLEAAQGA